MGLPCEADSTVFLPQIQSTLLATGSSTRKQKKKTPHHLVLLDGAGTFRHQKDAIRRLFGETHWRFRIRRNPAKNRSIAAQMNHRGGDTN